MLRGSRGRCRVGIREYNGKTFNEIKKFYEPVSGQPAPQPQQAQMSFEQGKFKMAMEMRPYQQEARQAVHEQWEDVDRTLLVLPTGTGKTIVFSKIVEDRVRAGRRGTYSVTEVRLLDQAADKLASATGLHCSTEKGRTDLHR